MRRRHGRWIGAVGAITASALAISPAHAGSGNVTQNAVVSGADTSGNIKLSLNYRSRPPKHRSTR